VREIAEREVYVLIVAVSKSIVTGQLGGIRMCIIVHLVLSLSLVAVHFGCSNHQLCDLEDKALYLEAAFCCGGTEWDSRFQRPNEWHYQAWLGQCRCQC